MIIEKLNKIRSATFAEVESSALVSDLIYLYSQLYANGGNVPAMCAKCRHDMFVKLNSTEAMGLAQQLQLAKNRTCVPNWVGLKFVRAQSRFYSDILISDAEAIEMLKLGILKESDFKVLPTDLIKSEPKQEITQPQNIVKKRGRKSK